MHLRTAADDSELRLLANSVSQIETEISHGEESLRAVKGEMEVLADQGAAERLAAVRLAVAHRGIKLQALMPRLQVLLTELRAVAGEEMLARASQPVRFER